MAFIVGSPYEAPRNCQGFLLKVASRVLRRSGLLSLSWDSVLFHIVILHKFCSVSQTRVWRTDYATAHVDMKDLSP